MFNNLHPAVIVAATLIAFALLIVLILVLSSVGHPQAHQHPRISTKNNAQQNSTRPGSSIKPPITRHN